MLLSFWITDLILALVIVMDGVKGWMNEGVLSQLHQHYSWVNDGVGMANRVVDSMSNNTQGHYDTVRQNTHCKHPILILAIMASITWQVFYWIVNISCSKGSTHIIFSHTYK